MGTSIAEVVAALGNVKLGDGIASTVEIKNPSGFPFTVIFPLTVRGAFARQRDLRALTVEAIPNTIFFRPDSILAESRAEDGGLFFHETVHNATGIMDDQVLAGKLNLQWDPKKGSAIISDRLRDDCFGGVK